MSPPPKNSPDLGWRFEKRVSLGDLLKTALAVAAIFLYLKDIETQQMINTRDIEFAVEGLEKETQNRKDADQAIRREMLRNESEMKEIYRNIQKSLERIEERLTDKVDKDDQSPHRQ